jgi:hypothetical protein
MNQIKKYNYRFAGLAALFIVTIVVIAGPGRALPEPSLLFLLPLLSIETVALFGMVFYPSGRVLDAEEIKLILRDYPELKSWVESLLDKNELVTLGRVLRVISEIASEEAEKQCIAKTNELLEEQRSALK